MAERGNSLNRFLDRWAGIPLALGTAGLRAVARPAPNGADKPGRVGFLCLGAIGDMLLFSSVVAALRRRLPHARFFLLTSRSNACTAGLVPGIDESASFGVRQIPAMVAWLRSKKLDVLLDSSQWPRLGAVLSNLSGAERTIGFDTPGQHRAFGYTCKVPHRGDRHEIENFMALGRAMYADLSGEPRLSLPAAPPEDALHAERMLAGGMPAGGMERGQSRPRIFLHMWPSGIHAWLKEWSAGRWNALARELDKRGFQVCLTCARAEARRNAAFLAAHPGCPALSLGEENLSLAGLAWMLSRAAAVVSVNTGIMHLAALTGTPTVGLHGPTNPLRWGPLGRATRSLLPRKGPCAYLNLGFEYPRPLTPCLNSLPVSDVLEALEQLGVFRADTA